MSCLDVSFLGKFGAGNCSFFLLAKVSQVFECSVWFRPKLQEIVLLEHGIKVDNFGNVVGDVDF